MLINVARESAGLSESADKNLSQDETRRDSLQRIEPQLDSDDNFSYLEIEESKNANLTSTTISSGNAASSNQSTANITTDHVEDPASSQSTNSQSTKGDMRRSVHLKSRDSSSSHFFISPWRQTVLDTVRHLIALHQPVIWVTGVEGVGKSAILQHFVSFFAAQPGEVLLVAAQDIPDSTSIYAYLWEKIQGTRSVNITLEVMLEALREYSQQHGQLRLLMDDVDQLTDTQIAQLLRLQVAFPVEQLQSIFFAHPTVMDILQSPAFEMIDQSKAEWVDVPAFNLKETHQFIEFYCLQHKIPSPGWRVEKIKKLHTRTEGLPGKIVPILRSQGQAIPLFVQYSNRYGVLPWIIVVLVAGGLLLWMAAAKLTVEQSESSLTPNVNEPINLAAISEIGSSISIEPVAQSVGEPSGAEAVVDRAVVDRNATRLEPVLPAIAIAGKAVEGESVENGIVPFSNQPVIHSESVKQQTESSSDAEAFEQVVNRNNADRVVSNNAVSGVVESGRSKTFAQLNSSRNQIKASETEKVAPVKAAAVKKVDKPIPASVASHWETVHLPAKPKAKEQAVKFDDKAKDRQKLGPTKVNALNQSNGIDIAPKDSKTQGIALKSEVVSKDTQLNSAVVKSDSRSNKLEPVGTLAALSASSTIASSKTPEVWAYRTWLMQREPSHYTLQLLGSASKQRVLDFIQRFSPNSEAKIAYFPTLHEGKPWYVVIYGDFASAELAVAASPDVQPSMVITDPWARSFGSIQSAVK